jgi:hypothetical protein
MPSQAGPWPPSQDSRTFWCFDTALFACSSLVLLLLGCDRCGRPRSTHWSKARAAAAPNVRRRDSEMVMLRDDQRRYDVPSNELTFVPSSVVNRLQRTVAESR